MKRSIFSIITGPPQRRYIMDVFAQRQQQAELVIDRLKQELVALNRIADNQQKLKEKREIEKIQIENNGLLQNIKSLKVQLQYYETQNGVKQVTLPIFKAKSSTSSQSAVAELPEEKPAPVANTEEKKQKSKKEDKKKDKSAAGKKPAAGNEQKAVDISRLCLKVGKIVEAKKHPDADGLLVETVDFGEERPRTICSGIVAHYQPEQMTGRMAIFACNLKPVKMRGIASEGMIMCASTPEKVEIVDVPQGAAIGDRVVSADYPGEPDEMLNPKRKIWEKIQPDLLMDGNGVATYKGSPLHVQGKGNCTAPTMKSCPIK